MLLSKWLGNRYGRLVVTGEIKNSKGLCKCDCGTVKLVNLYDAKNGKINSCGCLKREMRIEGNTTHGLREHRLYGIWANMKTRCTNIQSTHYKHYGGRGITMYDEWNDSFKLFYDWSMNNGYEDNLSIDRINNDGNYEPSNCRWTTMKVQSRNTRSNKIFTINGITKTLVDWCEDYNIIYQTVQDRLLRGWDIERALSEEVDTKYHNVRGDIK